MRLSPEHASRAVRELADVCSDIARCGGCASGRTLKAGALIRSCHSFISASIFAAQMKSFSDSPPTECVLYRMRHLL